MSIAEFILEQHPDMVERCLAVTESVLLLFVDSEGIVRYSNGVLIPGSRLDQSLDAEDGGSIDLDAADTAVPRIFRLCSNGNRYRCFVQQVTGGCFIMGEKLDSADMDVIRQMSQLTNQLTNITAELKQKNDALTLANEEIGKLMRTDPLTGLANRRLLYERMDPAMSLARRHNQPLSLLMTDIDHFKSVNDTWGHDGGDRVLVGCGEIFRNSLRNEDIAVRFGGEEFVVLMPNTALQGAEILAERIRATIEAGDFLANGTVITASFGVTCYQPGESRDTFLKRADTALYTAKDNGRNRCVVV